ncbi:hypothetical protein [Nonomuraea sp. SYSU D8015]|uniref:hypothetical protein n=1 Tax=Nonomuraea sp. SYSU D8015 TaxID=2593644 RepID=UPI001661554B|nr:hypothetical protein [Nonomuraea sp. SYSU D8015]
MDRPGWARIIEFGAFEQVDGDHPAFKRCHSEDRRTDLKQVQAGIAVTRNGGIPIYHRAFDGGAGRCPRSSMR